VATSTPTPAATSPTPTSSAATSLPPPWTAAQRNQFIAAYNGDPALAKPPINTAIACFMAVVPFRMAASLALDYVSVAWVGPTLTQAQIKQRLAAKYGPAQGTLIFTSWSPGAVNWSCDKS
jgi:hypothetical protein